jgi:DNA-binding MarR family transcriptional regulator
MPKWVLYSVRAMNVDEKEQELTLHILQNINADEKVSQRKLASSLGIAVGLTNSYLKRLIKKGLVKMEQVPANRYAYMLTPKGFSEKARLVTDYMHRSLSLYREASSAYSDCVNQLLEQNKTTVILCGASELTEIASLWLERAGVKVKFIFDQDATKSRYAHYDIAHSLSETDIKEAALLLTTMQKDRMLELIDATGVADMAHVIVPSILQQQ